MAALALKIMGLKSRMSIVKRNRRENNRVKKCRKYARGHKSTCCQYDSHERILFVCVAGQFNKSFIGIDDNTSTDDLLDNTCIDVTPEFRYFARKYDLNIDYLREFFARSNIDNETPLHIVFQQGCNNPRLISIDSVNRRNLTLDEDLLFGDFELCDESSIELARF